MSADGPWIDAYKAFDTVLTAHGFHHVHAIEENLWFVWRKDCWFTKADITLSNRHEEDTWLLEVYAEPTKKNRVHFAVDDLAGMLAEIGDEILNAESLLPSRFRTGMRCDKEDCSNEGTWAIKYTDSKSKLVMKSACYYHVGDLLPKDHKCQVVHTSLIFGKVS